MTDEKVNSPESLSLLNKKELGPQLINLAHDRWRKQMGDYLVRNIEELHRQKMLAENEIATMQGVIEDVNKKLAKIEAGEFDITRDMQIVFK